MMGKNLTAYDAIADIYDADMGANLSFDDVAFYRDQASQSGGPVLELGCGTGRVSLALAQAGFDIFGLDRSEPMIQRMNLKAAELGIKIPSVVADAAYAPFASHFRLIIAPFSMIVYSLDDEALDRVFETARRCLAPGGRFVVDAFIPRDMSAMSGFVLDYDRPFGSGRLLRRRRVVGIGGGRNEVTREYEIKGCGKQDRKWRTVEIIRPTTNAMLQKSASSAGFRPLNVSHDYGYSDGSDARFLTAIFLALPDEGRTAQRETL